MRRVLHLLEHVRLALLNHVVQLLLSAQLVNFQLPFQLFLLLDLLLGGFQITLQVQQEVWLLDHLQPPLELVVLLHEIDDGFVRVLDLPLGDAHSSTNVRTTSW